MVNNERKKKLSPSKEIAYIAITSALLLGAQFTTSFVVGVEVVTLIMACFSFVFGVRRGIICAVSFSLLRCVVFGFYPVVILLYLIYYPLLALLFGLLGKCKNLSSPPCAVIVNFLLITIAAVCAFCYFADVIKVAKVYAVTIKVLLWVIFSLCAILSMVYDCIYFSTLKSRDEILKVILLAGAGAVMSAIFTLTDDIITPLFWGYSRNTALAYFYSSFTAMLPQIICTIVSICTLFLPLSTAMQNAAKL